MPLPKHIQQQKDASSSKAYSVLYDSSDHFAVLTQMWGSLWPRVLPYCIFNVSLMILLSVLQREYFEDFEISSQGHSFIAVVVAFLLVSRVNTALGRFNEARGYLGHMYKETRELVSNMAVLSAVGNDSQECKEWRLEVSYRVLLLLRTSMAVIDYPTDFIAAWDLPELQDAELEDIRNNTYVNPAVRDLAHEQRSEFEESMRVPVRLSYMLKKSIHSHSTRLTVPLEVLVENKLLGSVDSFMNGYYGIRKFLTTPVPFPLIQMARTFLFAYVFTIPFALLSDQSSPVAHCCEVFILTYGFVGLELVAIELDNPFGDDENDFDNLAMANTCMEDTYLTLMDVDGEETTKILRRKMTAVAAASDEEATESTGLLA